MAQEKNTYFVDSGHIERYKALDGRNAMEKLYVSEQATLKYLLPKVKTVTDVGCLFGDMSGVVTPYGVKYTGIDFDANAIEIGQKKYPESMFHCADMLKPNLNIAKSDLVISFNVFDHFEDWKAVLRAYRRLTKKYINFSTHMRLNGPTVLDPEVSYILYPKRMLWAAHNIFELTAYCATSHIQATSIYVYAYPKFRIHNWSKAGMSQMWPFDPRDLLVGNVIVEVDEEREMEKTLHRPDLKIVIDGQVIFDSPWKHQLREG